MTYAPANLREVQRIWTSHGGVNLGIVGDVAHAQRGTSYHLGKSQLRLDAYSIRTARDRAGLTEAASAVDLGKLDGSFIKLRAFSRWLVTMGQSNQPGTRDLREVIYTPDGRQVFRWDRERGYASQPRTGEADNSHLYHTHISWYRDSESRDRAPLFRRYFGDVSMPDTSTEDPMSIIAHEPIGIPTSGVFRARKTGGDITTYPYDGDPRRGTLSAGAVRHALGPYNLTGISGGRTVYLVWEDAEFAFVAASDGHFEPNDGVNPAAPAPQSYPVIVGGKVIGEFTP